MISEKEKKTTLICLLDKQDPPDHSFLTGMLAQALPKAFSMRVLLVVAQATGGSQKPRRYHRAISIPVLPSLPRRGRERVLVIVDAMKVVLAFTRRARRRDERVVLFVRNDPLLLLVAAQVRASVDRVVFQSSFPLEESHEARWRRWLHRSIYKIGARKVDGVLAVSPLGLLRVRKLFSKEVEGGVIPLLSDLPMGQVPEQYCIKQGSSNTVRFVYVGTHRRRRRLDVVLEGVVSALDKGACAEFVFIGGTEREIDVLRGVHRVMLWETAGRIEFVRAVPRSELPSLLAVADIGLSLVPASTNYREASPTKLAEYMSAGLAVLASEGVKLQEEFLRESEAGDLVSFDTDAIAAGIQRLASEPKRLRACKRGSLSFAHRKLQYAHYVSVLARMIGANPNATQDRGISQRPPANYEHK